MYGANQTVHKTPHFMHYDKCPHIESISKYNLKLYFYTDKCAEKPCTYLNSTLLFLISHIPTGKNLYITLNLIILVVETLFNVGKTHKQQQDQRHLLTQALTDSPSTMSPSSNCIKAGNKRPSVGVTYNWLPRNSKGNHVLKPNAKMT